METTTRETALPAVPARRHGSAARAAIVAVSGFLVLAAVIVGLGLLLTNVLLEGAVGRWDSSVTTWFVEHRTSGLDEASRWGSDLGGTMTIVGIAFVAVVALAVARRWANVRLLVLALVIEFSIFLIATLLVDRPRPDVVRLDVSPPTSSYPSGHTAAAIVLYVGLALVVRDLTRNAILRAIAWILAVALPIAVGVSRLYRGMHHTTDVLASVILAFGALAIAIAVDRVASTRDRTTDEVPDR